MAKHKCIYWKKRVIISVLIIIAAIIARRAFGYNPDEQPWKIPLMLSPKTQVVLADLIQCESGGNEYALNANDLDNTPSYGLLQFKPGTLLSEGRRFGLLKDVEDAEVRNLLFDGQTQINVFLQMFYAFGHSSKWWLSQFPGCFRIHENKWTKLGVLRK